MAAPLASSPSPAPAPSLDACLFGYGIACGLTVHLTDACTIVVGAGTLVTRPGSVLHLPEKRFRYYRLPPPNAPTQMRFELVEGAFDAATMDSLKNQFSNDTPERYFLDDKIVVLEVDEQSQPPRLVYWLRSRHELVQEAGLLDAARRLAQPTSPSRSWGIFARHQPTAQFEVGPIEQALRPVLQLPDVVLPRFGYKTLAYPDLNRRSDFDDPATPVHLDNLRNPFAVVTNYETVFREYKAILDDAVPELADALAVLHTLFGPLLTHKGEGALKKYRRVLLHKWQVFLEQGAHLFYVQCYYDWLSDLHVAYRELRCALAEFDAVCGCADARPANQVSHVHLGPVMGGLTTYKPLIFRDYFRVPFIADHNERRLTEIKCLHWRLLMMIWTFDLPFLRLEQNVLVDEGYVVPAEEQKDSSDYWERWLDTPDRKGRPATFADLPIRITPGRLAFEPLGLQAIPYYFPLDADNPYSVHRYWDFAATHENRIDRHHSYNANRGADSYTSRPEVRFPLLYELRAYPLLRVEGHLGRKIDTALADAREVISKHNLGIEVVAVNVDEEMPVTESNLAFLLERFSPTDYRYNLGLEHQPGICAGHTWVLLFTAKGANIDLTECKKREGTLEIAANTVVADFVLPYRFSCCHRKPLEP